jgi:hypothetical protein
MTLRRWLQAAAFGLALLAAVTISARGDRGQSGIHGRVLAGCIDEPSPEPKPVVGIQHVLRWRKDGVPPRLVTRFRSEADGTFSLSLPPGHYQVVADPASPANGNMKPLDVTVRKGESTEIDPFYDCGML